MHPRNRAHESPLHALRPPAGGEVDLWLVDLVPAPDGEPPARVLSDDEMRRAARLPAGPARWRFVQTRAALRELLGAYLRAPAAELALTNGSGKPALRDGPRGLAFNVAHSHERALLAFGGFDALGVDLEYRDPRRDCDRIARRVLSPRELRSYERLDRNDRRRAFFDAWSRKEAILKARGVGLGFPPRETHVSLRPGDVGFVVTSAGHDWHVRAINAGPDYSGALAGDGPITRSTLRKTTGRQLHDPLQH